MQFIIIVLALLNDSGYTGVDDGGNAIKLCTKQEGKMLCLNCGTNDNDNSAFCKQCGSVMSESADTPADTPVDAPVDAPADAPVDDLLVEEQPISDNSLHLPGEATKPDEHDNSHLAAIVSAEPHTGSEQEANIRYGGQNSKATWLAAIVTLVVVAFSVFATIMLLGSNTPLPRESVLSNNPSSSPTQSTQDPPPDEYPPFEDPTYDMQPPFESDFSFSESIDENGFWLGVRALDYVELSNYRGITITSDVFDMDATVNYFIDDILAEFISYEQVDPREIILGDNVNIDYIGSIDGVEFENGSTDGFGTYVTIGVTQYIDGFLEQLIGYRPGDIVNVEVTFPDSYPQNQDLEGKEALFITTINYITDVIRPELTDEFIADNLSHFGWSTLDEMMDAIRAHVESIKNETIMMYVNDYLTENTIITAIPQLVINYLERNIIYVYQRNAYEEGVSFEEYLSWYGLSDLEDIVIANIEAIENQAVLTLILQAIAEDAQISVSDDEVAGFFMEHYGDYYFLESEYGMPMLKQIVLGEVVMNYVMERVVLA